MVRRLAWLSTGAAGLAIIAVIAGLFAGSQSNLAEARAAVNEARRTAQLALDEPEFERALLLAVEAIHLWDDPEMRVNLVRVISRAPQVVSITRVPDATVSITSMSLAQDGSRASVIDSDDDVRLLDLSARSQLGEYSPSANSVVTSAIDPQSGDVAMSEVTGDCTGAECSFQRTAAIDLAGGDATDVTAYRGMGWVAADVEYSPDGSLLAAIAPIPASTAGNVALWLAEDPTTPLLLDLTTPRTEPAAPFLAQSQYGIVKFSSDGSLLYASGFGPTLVFDTETGEQVSQVAGFGLLAVSPDGRRVAVRDGPLSVRIVDIGGGTQARIIATSTFPWSADFSPDGAQLAIADGTRVAVSDARTDGVTQTLDMEDGGVIAVEFLPSGELVAASADGLIMTWDLGDWSKDFRTQRFQRALPIYEEDERTFVSQPIGGTTEVVIAEPEAWEARACQVAGRALSGEEWTELFGDRPYTPACRG